MTTATTRAAVKTKRSSGSDPEQVQIPWLTDEQLAVYPFDIIRRIFLLRRPDLKNSMPPLLSIYRNCPSHTEAVHVRDLEDAYDHVTRCSLCKDKFALAHKFIKQQYST